MFPRGSLLPNMFENDPFFRDPFAHMDGMMRQMMNDPFMGFGHMGMPHSGNPHPGSQVPGPVVEEVEDDWSKHAHHPSSQPIVEEPDDEPRYDARGYDARGNTYSRTHHSPSQPLPSGGNQLGFGGFPGFGMGGGMGGGSSYMSYSSSTFSSAGGPNGVTYSSTTTSRMGPGGVRETQQTIRDGRTGLESVAISRGVKDKARTVKRMRDASGREVTEQYLDGLTEEDAPRFEEEWRREAEQKLPTWGLNSRRLPDPSQRRQQPTLALPDSAGAGLRRSNSRGHQASGGYYV